MSRPAPLRPGWILSAAGDVAVFTGPLIVAGALVLWAAHAGVLHEPLPAWAFAVLIVGVDVAHVYSTAFRVYLDPREMRRRPGLYLGVPMLCFAGGVALHASGPETFWRALAYLAVFHFVRQQWGWMAYARRQAGERGALDLRLDQVAIYNATLFPLLWWHANLPRAFHWFVDGDFVALPAVAGIVGHAVHWSIWALYLGRQVQRLAVGHGVNWAKLHVLATTWIAWYGGIVVLESDIAFTATNVLAHGVPYLAVVWRVERGRWQDGRGALARLFRPGAWPVFLGLLVAAGYGEEWLWDRAVWREHAALFPGTDLPVGGLALALLVPLLALPQATHYVLDGWIWRTREYGEVRRLFGTTAVADAAARVEPEDGPVGLPARVAE